MVGAAWVFSSLQVSLIDAQPMRADKRSVDMVRQWRWSALLLATLFLLLSSLFNTPPLLAQDKSLVWDRFDVNLDLNADGTVVVAEHQTIRFTNGTFVSAIGIFQSITWAILITGPLPIAVAIATSWPMGARPLIPLRWKIMATTM